MSLAVIDGNNVPKNLKTTTDAGELVPHHVVQTMPDVRKHKTHIAYLKGITLQDSNIFAGACRLKSITLWVVNAGGGRNGVAVHVYDLDTAASDTSTSLFMLYGNDGQIFRQMTFDGVDLAVGLTVRITKGADDADVVAPAADDLGVIVEYELAD